ncbi:MAG: S8 family serine peptidase [Cytophagales bacterium]|nr:S8 family serine peptidase [Cytophagales bacterium]
MKKIYALSVEKYQIFLFLFLLSMVSIAQTNQVYEGLVRIKVDETTASYLQEADRSLTNEGYVITGKGNLDNALLGCKAHQIERVFKPLNNAYEAKHRKHGLHLWYEVKFDKEILVDLALEGFEGVSEVILSEPVYEKKNIGYSSTMEKRIVQLGSSPNDPQFVDQWHYDNTGQTGGTAGADISLIEAWGIETGNNQIIVAVTDGGIDVAHEDLAANMWVNTNEIPGNGIDDDNNGYVDDINGYGFGDDTGTIPADYHGTHVGGTIAAITNNGIGVSGVAGGDGSGDGVRLMSLAAFGEVSTGNFEGTYIYAADNGAVISQNSWGYTVAGNFEQVVLDAIDYFIAEAGFDAFGNPNGSMQGGLVVFAAGNSGSYSDYYPGFYDPVLAVGGTDHNDDEYVSSNRGPWVDVAAPAVNVLSTFPNNEYGTISGTSMACPHVSGLAGLIVSRNIGNITADQVRFLIEQTTDSLPGLEFLGSGRINAFAALQFNDGAPPTDITDLVVAGVDLSSATLQWTAPADAGSVNASNYDIRYSTSLIDNGNFDLATAVSNPPATSVAGTLETFAVIGLNPATQYFFAIKSADFFGNVSGISNVASAMTNDVPLASVTPDSLISNLITGEAEIQIVTLSNTGIGPLDFDISFTETTFLSANIINGTVAPGGNQDIEIIFNASGLFGGIYTNDVAISTNDPANPSLIIPATLNVTGTGTPIISVAPTSLIFNTLFVGASESMVFEISNNGTELLNITDITSDSPDFTVTSAVSFSVLPFEIEQITIQYSPTVLGALSGSITIVNNDIEQQVAVSGIGVEPPVIAVNPASISAELVGGDSETSVLTISNTGVADLTFDLEITESGGVTTAIQTDLPARTSSATVSGGKVKQPISSNFEGMLAVSNVRLLAGQLEVLLLTPDDDISDLESTLSAFPDLNVTRFPQASLTAISLADIADFDVVMATNNTQWQAGGNVSPVVIGDLLADYIDQGGKVIANSFAYDYDAWAIAGRFINEGYGPFVSTTSDFSGSVSLGTVHAPSHPVMEGVTAIGNSYLWQDPSLASGATLLADWSDGHHFAAVNDNVVALNILPSDGNGVPGWTGDLATLYHNAIIWMSGPVFVSTDQKSGTLTTGQSLAVNVTLSAESLEAGLYEADINIISNDPVSNLTVVSVALTALGPPVVASPSSFNLTLEKGETAMETLSLTNNSKNDATYDISIANGSTASVTMNIPPVPLMPRTEAYNGILISETSTKAIFSPTPTRLTTEQYATGFEDFAIGDINGQQGWTGQYGNWAISALNPSEGNQSIESLSDGLGQTLAFSPEVPVGSDATSSFTTKIGIQGSGVTWELIPQSYSESMVNTRLRFNPNGTVDALVSDGIGGAIFQSVPVTVPSGYFKVDIEIERATSQYKIFFDDVEVFSALGFAGNIEQLVLLSEMEVFGPTLFVDELQILDGPVKRGVPFVSVNPISGTIPTGSSVNLDVIFDSSEQEFGIQEASIVVAVNGGSGESVIVPTTLNVTGDPAIEIDPQVVIEVVEYNKPTTRTVSIINTGGNPLTYELDVFGAEVGTTTQAMRNRLATIESNTSTFDDRVMAKLAEDNALTTKLDTSPPTSRYITVGDPIFTEDFEGGVFPPTNWSTLDNEGNGVVWSFTAAAGEGNYSGTGDAATISSDAFGQAEFDAELKSPAIDIAGKSNLVLKYNVNYQNFESLDFLNVDLSIDGGTTWTTLLSWNEDHGSFRGLPGEQVEIPLDGFVSGATSIMFRWHYFDPNAGDWDWYAQIDNVQVVENSEVWLAVNNASGSVPVGESADVELQFDPTVVDPGLYLAGIFVESNAVLTPLNVVLVAMEELGPAIISTDSGVMEEELVAGRNNTQTLVITNSGESVLDFEFEDNFSNVGEAQTITTFSARRVIEQARSVSADLRQNKAFTSLSSAMVQQRASVVQNAIEPPVDFSNVLYATNFEGFNIGDINDQQGWSGQYANWQIGTSNPSGNSQHIRSVSDGWGLTLAISPEVPIGTEKISSTSMMVDFEGGGVTWQIIPQSNSQGFVATRLSFEPDGTASALVIDNGGEYQPISASIPEGYFEVKIEIDRETNEFIIYFDGTAVFNGIGFSGSVEQVVFLSLMEEADPTMDIDNLQIVDGVISELSVSVSPTNGSIPSGSSQNIAVRFDATNLLGGIYEEDLIIHSNDPTSPETVVATELVVIDPQIISVAPEELSAEVNFKQAETKVLTVTNSGVADLIFQIDVGNELATAGTTHQLNTGKDWESDSRIVDKVAQDNPSQSFNMTNSLVKKHGVVAILQEGFEGGIFPPANWTMIDNEGTGVEWRFAADYGDDNYTGGSGEAATVNSDDFGRAEFDTELRSPAIETTGQPGLSLQYDVNYQNFASLDFLNTDISTDGGLTWTTMLSWNEDHGSFFGSSGEVVSIDLDPYLTGATNFILRWHYFDPNSGDWDWYAQIDNVVVGVPWLSVSQAVDTLSQGESIDIDVTFDASLLDAGNYVSNLSICSNDLRNPQVTVPVDMLVLTAPQIVFEPDTLELVMNDDDDHHVRESFIISNAGESPLEYYLVSVPDFVKIKKEKKKKDHDKKDKDVDHDKDNIVSGVLNFGENREVKMDIKIHDHDLESVNLGSIVFGSNDPINPFVEFVIKIIVQDDDDDCDDGDDDIDEDDNISSLTVGPNPFTNNITIRLESLIKENYEITIYNFQGQIVYKDKLKSYPNELVTKDIRTESFLSGFYRLTISTKHSEVESLTLVK